MQNNKKIKNPIKVFALGGLGEVGKNMYCIEQNNEIVIIDCGILFPEDNYGVNYIIPDFTYLKRNEEKIIGLFITHGHEDHIGAIPYLLKSFKLKKIYASGIAINLIKNKLSEAKTTSINIIEYNENSIFQFKNFEISFFRTTHSIPDSFGIALKTNLGYIVHTGDFKFDLSPIGKPTEFNKIASFYNKTLLLLSDSTNANLINYTPSEKKIGENIMNLFESISGRIIISTFASNVYRLQQIVNASIKCHRKIIVFGRSMEKVLNASRALKYINAPADTFISAKEFEMLKPNQITIISTGSQGEPLAALSRIADGTHKNIKLVEGDTIIFSSSVIPGNQEHINRTINKLYKAGANVIVNSPLYDTHTSGHASSSELELMLSLIKPKYFMPIHGENSMLRKHVELACEVGIPKENCFIMKNGDVLQISQRKAEINGKVTSGEQSIDEEDNIISEDIIKERKSLAAEGVITFTYIIHQNRLQGKPHFNSRGFVYMKSSNELINDLTNKAYKIANSFCLKYYRFYEKKFIETMQHQLEQYIYEKCSMRPVVIIIPLQI